MRGVQFEASGLLFGSKEAAPTIRANLTVNELARSWLDKEAAFGAASVPIWTTLILRLLFRYLCKNLARSCNDGARA
jgi:hypothetical protein